MVRRMVRRLAQRLACRPHQAQAGQAIVEYLFVITVVGFGFLVGGSFLQNSTAAAYNRQSQALVAPTFAAITYVAPTATATATPMPTATAVAQADMKIKARSSNSGDTTKETQYQLRLENNGKDDQGGFTARIFLDLSEVYAAGSSASNVGTTEFWDQCNAASFSPVTVWDSARSLYFVDVSFGNYQIPAKGYCEVQFRVYMTNWQPVWNDRNDPSAQGLNGNGYGAAPTIPVYRNGVLVFGRQP